MGALVLTRVEQKIFDRILHKGETSLGPIIKELGLHKGTVYNSIRRLEEKGLISYKTVDGINVYCVNKLALKKLLSEEEANHEQSIKNLNELIRIAGTTENESGTTVHVLLGPQGFKSFFNELYDWASKARKEYFFIGKGNEMIEHLGEEYYRRTQASKRKLGLKCRVILNEMSRVLPVAKYVVGNVRYLKMEHYSPMSIWLYGDAVALVLWDAKPITTILIRSKEASNSFRSYFEHLWMLAKQK